jgi:hypothetical protein
VKLRKHLVKQKLTGDEEISSVPIKKYLKPVGQNGYDRPKYAPVRKIWLETAVVDVSLRIDALCIQTRICNLKSVVRRVKEGFVEGYAQKRAYVKLIANQPKNPPTVVRLTNQLKKMHVSQG